MKSSRYVRPSVVLTEETREEAGGMDASLRGHWRGEAAEEEEGGRRRPEGGGGGSGSGELKL